MPGTEEMAYLAGELFRVAAGFSFEDAEPRRLRYHLLRLTVVGLAKEDVADLGELGRLAFQGSDVKTQATKIKQRVDASPLAFAIADIVEQAGDVVGGRVDPKAVMLGAVLGAYTSLGGASDVPESSVATLGAIGGAVAASTSTFVADNINQQSWFEYLRMDE
jgi:hypothetical protein